ncbi:MAG: DNA primase [Hyphomicrobiaceae bacterium]|nr:DNA primase [Hyphomicrobiaceae bacterium]
MRFDPSFLDEIRARLAVSHVVSKRVKLKRQGREFIGLSPFKQEKTPSFTVNDQKGFYHCFASGEHGDIFTFVQKMEGLSFPESVEQLAREAGLEMPKSTPQEQAREKERDRLREAMEEACRYFEAALADKQGHGAREYLHQRGVTEKTSQTFRLGFGGRDRHGLKEHLASKGYSAEEMVEAGLIIAGDDIPVSYDRFRERLIFPITDQKGQVIAFGGRALSDRMKAKYVNSPETRLFHKGYVLFNQGPARQAAFERDQILVVEGYMDVIALAQAGFSNAVAPLGTALTEDQMRLLWRMAPEPVLCFDGDEAGRKAAHRAVDTALPLLEPGRSLKFCFLPRGQDPDDFLAEQGADAFRGLIDKAFPLVRVLWSREVEAGDFSTPERRAALEDRLAELLKQISHKRVRRHYGEEIALQLKRLWLTDQPVKHAPGPAKGTPRARFERSGNRGFGGRNLQEPWEYGGASESLKQSALVRGASEIASREALILRTLFNHPWLFEDQSEQIASLTFRNRRLEALRDEMLSLTIADNPLDFEAFRTHLRDSESGAIVAQIDRAITHKSDWFAEPDASRTDVETGWRQILALHRRSVELGRELEAAQNAFQDEGSDSAFERLCDIRRQLTDLEGVEASIEGYGEESGRAGDPLA